MTGVLSKILHGFLLSLGLALGLWVVFAFQVTPTTPSTSGVGTGTTDSKNESLTSPILSRSGATYDRNSMSLQAISEGTNTSNVTSGMYNNRIILSTYPAAYTEICFKNGSVYNDQHTAGQSTSGGNCLPGDIGFVIEQNLRTAQKWEYAKVTCTSNNMRLPEVFEWKYACNAGGFGLVGMATVWEWVGNSPSQLLLSSGPGFTISTSVLGAGACYYASYGYVGTPSGGYPESSIQYRCVK